MIDINVDLLQWFVNFFDKKASGSGIKNKNIPKKQLAEELHKSVIRKFNKRKIHSSFIDNIQGADLAYMQLKSKFNRGFRFLLCVIDTYSKYTWFIPLKDKEEITISNAFQQMNQITNQIRYRW